MVGFDSTSLLRFRSRYRDSRTPVRLHGTNTQRLASHNLVYVGTMLYKNWRALHKSDHPFQIPLSLLVRVAVFSLVCVIGIGCAFVFLANVSYFAGNIIIGLSESSFPFAPRSPLPASPSYPGDASVDADR